MLAQTGVVERFHCSYLLTSLAPNCKNHTYIGYTVHPKRRIRQHNGEIKNGAKKTSKKRPWEMVLLVHGFPSSNLALYFEWCWQHPHEAKVLRDAVTGLRVGVRTHLPAKLRYLYEMLHLPQWSRLPLTVHWVNPNYQKDLKGGPTLSPQISVSSGPIDSLYIYQGGKYDPKDEDSEDHTFSSPQEESAMELEDNTWASCHWCKKFIEESSLVTCPTPSCKRTSHLCCLAYDFLEQEANRLDLLPTQGKCNNCQKTLSWPSIVQRKKRKQPRIESDKDPQPPRKKNKTTS